ncbi:hypothetical protein ACM66B_006402 [Microbotryomycetes sp. NB124-2]
MAPRSASPKDISSEDIPPLAYDSEHELLEVLARLRRELEERVNRQCNAITSSKSKGKQEASSVDKDRVLDIVLQQFFDHVQPAVFSNCSIAGVPYEQYKREHAMPDDTETQPFSEELHKRVLINQNQLFDDREVNIRKRREEPAMAAQAVKEIIDTDMNRVEATRATPLEFADSKPPPKPRKSVGHKAEDGPSAQQAQQDFEQSKATIDKLLKTVPKLSNAAEEATKVARDASMIE